MSSRLSIRYFFNNLYNNEYGYYSIYSIPEKDILEILESHNYFVNKDLIEELLIKDHAIFDENSIRIYDENEQGFVLLTSDYVLEVDENDCYLSLVLCLQPKSVQTTLENRIKVMEETFNHQLNMLKEEYYKLKSIQKGLLRQVSKILSNSNLEDSVKDLEKSNNYMSSSISYNNIENNDNSNSSKNIDLAVMFAEPLVYQDPILGCIRSVGDPVDYEEECAKLLENLRKKKKKIEVVFDIATSDSLLGILEKGPTILHIICHGEYSKEQNDFYLAFEQNGMLHPIYSENLQEILEKVKPQIKLVFVNACHSELIAGVFKRVGIPCVIAIQSELKIEDVVAQHFASIFYDKLFDGKTIQESFELAQLSSKNKFSMNINTCCCSHSHKPGCRWYQFALEEGFYKAHLIHTPTCEECKQRFQNIHLNSCRWAIQFIEHQMDDLPDPDFIDSSKYRYTCCCSPELQHNESLKFKKICDSEVDKLILFNKKETGDMKKLEVFNSISRKFHVKKVTGRNIEMFDLFNLITDRHFRFIELYGIEGIGKTTLIKQTANYLYERGYFTDNIIMLTLDKTNSITTFLAQLYKYFPAYDLEGLCHLIKHSKILFILEKCESLYDKFPKEFNETLEYMANNTNYVNFVFVTNRKVKFGLDEKSVELQELDNTAAAKLLLKYAFSSLEISNRNLFSLEKHVIFSHIPKTPQHIWYIAEKLKGEYFLDLDRLAIDTEKSLALANNISGSHVIGSALEMLRDRRDKAYTLLLRICLFPAGLTFYDFEFLKDLRKLENIEWGNIIKELTIKENEVNELQNLIKTDSNDANNQNNNNNNINNSNNNDEINGSIANTKDSNVNNINNCNTPTNNTLIQDEQNETIILQDEAEFIPNSYFWVTVDKLYKDTDYITHVFIPNQFVADYIQKNYKNDILKYEYEKLEYMTHLSLLIIEKMKLSYNEHYERISEISSFCNYGAWSLQLKEYQDNFAYQTLKNTPVDNMDPEVLKKFFMHHELNFVSCIDFHLIERITHLDNNKNLVFKLFSILSITLPSLLMKLTSRIAYARDIAIQALSVAGKFPDNKEMIILMIKLHLFLASSYVKKNNQSEINALALEELNMARKINEQFTDTQMKTSLAADIAFLNAYYYYKLMKKQSRLMPGEIDKKTQYQKTTQYLIGADDNATSAGVNHNVLLGKIILLKIKAYVVFKAQIEKADFAKLREAIKYFDENHTLVLDMIANYLYVKLRLKVLTNSNHMNPNKMNKASNVAESLLHVRNHYLIKKALYIAHRIKETSYESKVKTLIDEINLQIRKEHYNIFILMRAAPLVEINESWETENKGDMLASRIIKEEPPKAISDPIRTISSFRLDLINKLKQKKKSIFLKFEILTKETLKDSLENGCRVLYLKIIGESLDGYLTLEDRLGKLERMSFDDIRSLFAPKLSGSFMNVGRNSTYKLSMLGKQNMKLALNEMPDPKIFDVVILAGSNCENIANLFCELKIPHVITFKFNNNQSYKENFTQKIVNELYVDKFTEFFYDLITDNKSIDDSFNNAKSRLMEYFSEKFYGGDDPSTISKIFGDGAILLPKDADHTEKLFEGSFTLSPGDITEISKQKFGSNLSKPSLPITGRNIEIYEILRKIKQFKHVEIYGQPGVGKTTIGLHVGYFFLTRHYYPDGIYFIPLGRLSSQEDIKDYMKWIFGAKIEYNLLGSFKGKDMLFIFDDFDHEECQKIPFMKVLLRTLKEFKISILIICKDKKHTYSNNESTLIAAATNTNNNNNNNNNNNISMPFFKLKTKNKHYDNHNDTFCFERIFIQPMTNEDMTYMLLSYIDLDPFQLENALKELMNSSFIEEFQGIPKNLLSKLQEEKIIKLDSIELELKREYKAMLNLDKSFTPVYIHLNNEKLHSLIKENSMFSTQNPYNQYVNSTFDIQNIMKHYSKGNSKYSQDSAKNSKCSSPQNFQSRQPSLVQTADIKVNPPKKFIMLRMAGSIEEMNESNQRNNTQKDYQTSSLTGTNQDELNESFEFQEPINNSSMNSNQMQDINNNHNEEKIEKEYKQIQEETKEDFGLTNDLRNIQPNDDSEHEDQVIFTDTKNSKELVDNDIQAIRSNSNEQINIFDAFDEPIKQEYTEIHDNKHNTE